MNDEQAEAKASASNDGPSQVLATIYLYQVGGGWDELNDSQARSLFASFNSSPLSGESPDRFGFVQMSLLDDKIIYGYFAQEYQRTRVDYDELKRQSIADERDFMRHLFVLQPHEKVVYLQHRRKSHHGLPEWKILFERFNYLFQLTVRNAGFSPPSLSVATIGASREEFIRSFNDPLLRVTMLDLRDFDASLLPDGFKFFNPKESFNEVYEEGNRITTRNVRHIRMESTKGGDLSRSPDAKGYVQTSRSPQHMHFVDIRTETETHLERRQERRREIFLPTDRASESIIREVISEFPSDGAHRHSPRRPPRRRPGQLSLFGSEESASDDL